MDEQPGFVVEGERVALGPLRLDLVPTYQRWENDLEVANGNGRVMPFTLATAAWNQRAIRVYTKVGFREVGRRRSAGVTMGRRYDAVFMDLLAAEFRQRGWSVLAGRTPQGGIQSLRRQRP